MKHLLKHNRHILNQSGITLVELVVAMGLTTIITAGIIAVSQQKNKLESYHEEKSGQLIDESFARIYLTRDLRGAAPNFFFTELKVANNYNLETKPSPCFDSTTSTDIDFWELTEKRYCQGREIELNSDSSYIMFLSNTRRARFNSVIIDPNDLQTAGSEVTKVSFQNALKAKNLDDDTGTLAGMENQGLYKVQAMTDQVEGGKTKSYAILIYLDDTKLEVINKITVPDTSIETELYNVMKSHCDTSIPKIETFKDFLDCFPTVGVKSLKVTPVEIVIYKSDPSETEETEDLGKNFYKITRLATLDGTNFREKTIFQKVRNLRFYRGFSDAASIKFDVNMR